MKAPWSRIGALTSRRGGTRERAPVKPRSLVRQDGLPLATKRIGAMMQSCATKSPVFPPTTIYNERWLLRLVLDWFSANPIEGHPLNVTEKGRWFSEVLLPTTFTGSGKAARLAETSTHADAVVGHFDVGTKGKDDLSLRPDAKHLVVLEAKIFSGLSPGVTNAKYFDQAARTVACIAEVLRCANRPPSDLSRLCFYVVAPQVQIARSVFEKAMSRSSINRKVKKRVNEYGVKKDKWYTDWFQPTLQQIEVGTLSWEELIRTIGEHDATSAASIQWFYLQCIGFSEQSSEGSSQQEMREE